MKLRVIDRDKMIEVLRKRNKIYKKIVRKERADAHRLLTYIKDLHYNIKKLRSKYVKVANLHYINPTAYKDIVSSKLRYVKIPIQPLMMQKGFFNEDGKVSKKATIKFFDGIENINSYQLISISADITSYTLTFVIYSENFKSKVRNDDGCKITEAVITVHRSENGKETYTIEDFDEIAQKAETTIMKEFKNERRKDKKRSSKSS